MTLAPEPAGFTEFVAQLMATSHRRMLRAIEGLDDLRLHHQPAHGANSIAWLVWHLSRWKDTSTAAVLGEQSVWLREGWPARFGLPSEATGYGDTPEQVAAFHAERDVLMGYVEAAHQAAMRRMAAMTPALLRAPFRYNEGDPERPAWRAIYTNVIDFMEHTGQIAYLRGMLGGPGWMG
jgi:hypothetical protein